MKPSIFAGLFDRVVKSKNSQFLEGFSAIYVKCQNETLHFYSVILGACNKVKRNPAFFECYLAIDLLKLK